MSEGAARRAPLWFTAGGLCLLGGLCVALGPVLFEVAGTGAAPLSLGWFAGAGGALHSAAAALLGAALFARGRKRAAEWVPPPPAIDEERAAEEAAKPAEPPAPPTAAELAKGRQRALARAAWVEAGLVLLVAGSGVVLRWRCWPTADPLAYSLPLGVTALVACFPLLVLERRLATLPASEAVEAAGIARVLRAVLFELALTAIDALARKVGFASTYWIGRVGAGLGLLVGGELALRALVRPLLPVGDAKGAVSLVDSFSASVLLAKFGPARGFSDALRERFGVDLSRLWAFRYLRNAAAPLVAGLCCVAWLTSGLTVLQPDERGVYERMGEPVAVVPSGLAVHLPWPFGTIRKVEFGVVHSTPVALDVEAPVEESIGVEAAPPPSVDRLWSQSHPTEGSYLIPGVGIAAGSDAQSFQLATADVKIGWRIGLDDDSARRALFQVADGDALVRALSGRLLVRDFATRPLDKVIGDDRDRLASSIHAELQRQLDALQSGLEVTAVLIDAIHPPVGAAGAYHRVQAAEIASNTAISVERTRRARLEAEAAGEAIDRKYSAQAVAGERIAAATAARHRFDADQASFTLAGPVLALERWLQTLAKSLVRARFDLIDHRLELEPGPTLDLRSSSPALPASGYE